MSAVSLRRYRVTFVVCSEYDIIVEAISKKDAIRKAKHIYDTNGLGDYTFDRVRAEPRAWHAMPLVPEVQR